MFSLLVVADPVGTMKTMMFLQALEAEQVVTLNLHLCMFPLLLTLYQLALAEPQLLICVLIS
jgi:hypothetical protein